MNYFVYILECSDKTYYIGLTNDVKRRVHAHNTLKVGAKYTSTRRPVILKYVEEVGTRGEAMKRERALKKLTRMKKEALILTPL